FCLFNNVAVAARHATHELEVERVLICDWDVHHPNGTEEIFAASDEVLLASIHQSPLYPGTGPARYEGDGAGEGYTVNMPVEPGAGSDRFVALVEHVVAPLARAFEPGLIVVSAGFDAHRRDPLASCTVDERGFAEMAALIRDVARELDVGVLVCLEGGYDVESLISSSFAMIEAFEGDLRAEPRPAELAEPHRGRVAERWSL
ncbi:MAG: histone deacetylase, partial [Solirubrobacterales bacterium]|nr:histone deacetylase [Solirubrobacterales bacterium]